MNLQNLRLSIAEHLGLLSSDGSTIIESRVTSAGIDRKINQIYREQVAQMLMNNHPGDFEQVTYPLDTYTSTQAVVSLVGTTLTTGGTFNNFDEGFVVSNPTKGETAVIETYTSSTVIELVAAPPSDWTGDTIYVLGNLFTFQGDLVDLKEVINVGIKYNNDDDRYTYAELIRKNDYVPLSTSLYSAAAPKYFLTTVKNTSDVSYRAIGILPHPQNYDGKIQITYTQLPPELENNGDEPQLQIIGISGALIYGTVEWGFRLLNETERASEFGGLYREQIQLITKKYKPRSKGYRGKQIARSYYYQMRTGKI